MIWGGKRCHETSLYVLDEKFEELQSMKATLEHLVHCCHGDDRPDCPIIDSLAQGAPAEPTQNARLELGVVAAPQRLKR